MITTIKGYYDGNQVVIDQADRQYLKMGDMLTINVIKTTSKLDVVKAKGDDGQKIIENRLTYLRSRKGGESSNRTIEEIDQYLKESRDDRF